MSQVTLMDTSLGGITVAVIRWPHSYLVKVSDEQGPLHVVEFPFVDANLLDVASQDEACSQALDWHDNCVACVEQYLDRPTSQSIAALINTVLH